MVLLGRVAACTILHPLLLPDRSDSVARISPLPCVVLAKHMMIELVESLYQVRHAPTHGALE